MPLHTYNRSAPLAGGAECKIGGHSHDHVRMLSMHSPKKEELLGLGAGNHFTQGPSQMLLEGFRAGAASLMVEPTPPSSSFSTPPSSFAPMGQHHPHDREVVMYRQSSRPREESMRTHQPLASPSIPAASSSPTPALGRLPVPSTTQQIPPPDVRDFATAAASSSNNNSSSSSSSATRQSVVRAGAAALVSTSVYKAVKKHQHKQDRQAVAGNEKEEKTDADSPAGQRSATNSRAEVTTTADWKNTVESAPRWSQLRSYTFVRSLGKGAHAEALLMERGSGEERGRVKQKCVLKVSKCFLPEAVNEARLLGQLSTAGNSASAHVVRLEDVFVEQVGGRHVSYLQLEYCQGGDLGNLLRGNTHEGRQHALDDTSVHRLAGQLLAALESLHSQHVVHRDFKPDNILLTADGQVKLCDFGIATRLTDAWSGGNTFAAGSLPFMSPETRRLLLRTGGDDDEKGGGKAGEEATAACMDKADVWALGCVLYAMCLNNPTPNLINVPPLQAVAEVCGHRGWPAFDFSLGPVGMEGARQEAQQVCWLLALALEPNPALRPSAAELRRALIASEATSKKKKFDTGLAARL